MAQLLSTRSLQTSITPPRRMDTAQVALLQNKTMQASYNATKVFRKQRNPQMAKLDNFLIRQRLLA
jgi:hypothetical protein